MEDAQAGAAPHQRGWTPGGHAGIGVLLGCPAPAGMDPNDVTFESINTGLPRTSGDGPTTAVAPRAPARAAPHQRGWTLKRECLRSPSVGCPAPAGMDPRHTARQRSGPRLPRTSGDGPVVDRAMGLGCAAAPHQRGWTPSPTLSIRWPAGCPAPAGMDPIPDSARLQRRGLPRTSGDGPYLALLTKLKSQAAPHQRGWTQKDSVEDELIG